MNFLAPRVYEGHNIRQRADRYLNATDMAKAAGKQVNHYLVRKETTAFLEAMKAVPGIPGTELIQVRQGGTPAEQGTWMHPHVAMHFAQWCSVKLQIAVAGWLFEMLEAGQAAASNDGSPDADDRPIERIDPRTLRAVVNEIIVASRVQTSFAEEIPEGSRKYLAVEVRGRFIYEGFPLKRANAVAKDVRICLESQEYTYRGRLVYELKPDAPEFRVRKSGPPFGMYYIHRDHMPLFDEAYRKTIAATPRLRRNAAPTLFNLHGA